MTYYLAFVSCKTEPLIAMAHRKSHKDTSYESQDHVNLQLVLVGR